MQGNAAQSLSFTDFEEKLNTLRKNLTKEKYDRIHERAILISEDSKFSRRLGYPLFQAQPNSIDIMSRLELQLFKKHVENARQNWVSYYLHFGQLFLQRFNNFDCKFTVFVLRKQIFSPSLKHVPKSINYRANFNSINRL